MLCSELLRDFDGEILESFQRIIGNDKPAVGAALAFYMRPGERPNSFEFLHKTFAEYLVSRRLVAWISSLSEVYLIKVKKKIVRGFDVSLYLRDWIRLTGPRAIDFDLLRFFRDEVASRYAADRETVLTWREMLIFCFKHSLRNGMPAHLLFTLPDDLLVLRPQQFKDAVDQARNAEETFLAAINATILPELDTPEFAAIDLRYPEHDRTSMGWLMRRLIGQRSRPNLVATSLFAGIDFSGERLEMQDMYELNARKSKFNHSEMYAAVLEQADLRGAEFDGASIASARLVNTLMHRGQMEVLREGAAGDGIRLRIVDRESDDEVRVSTFDVEDSGKKIRRKR